MERLVLLGRDHPSLGVFEQRSLGLAAGCVSAGSDPESPSFAFKGDKGGYPNEDGLVILKDGQRWLLAVADGHLGHETSHALLEGLAGLGTLPPRLGPLSLALASADWIEDTAGGATLLVACIDEKTGAVFGISFGDSSLVVLNSGGARVKNELNDVYLRGGSSIEVETGRPFQFQLLPEETLLIYTDGVNECCYRDPFRSVKLQHLDQVYAEHPHNTAALAQAVIELAMAGVEGNPGGQDNIAVAALKRPAE